jgi:ribonuclease P/MRP protein subunit RPP1
MKLKRIKLKSELSKNDSSEGYIIDSSEKEARKIIESLKGKDKKIALMGGDDAFNRRAIETLKIDFLISPERGIKKDTLKQRDSGINHIVAKEASKKNISFVVDFNEVQKLKGKEKANRLEKIIQNIKICRKAKCKIKTWDFSKKIDNIILSSFGATLGMSSEQQRDSVSL